MLHVIRYMRVFLDFEVDIACKSHRPGPVRATVARVRVYSVTSASTVRMLRGSDLNCGPAVPASPFRGGVSLTVTGHRPLSSSRRQRSVNSNN